MRLAILFLLITFQAFSLESPFKSTVAGLDVPNAHNIDNRYSVYRGMSPMKHMDNFMSFGFTDVLIFKNDTRGEVAKEVAELTRRGFDPARIYTIPFAWKDLVSYKQACGQTIKALQILRYAHSQPKRKIFFHCTVGEDRTGVLSGLWKMINLRWSAKSSFEHEMCQNGYGGGNPKKPSFVVSKIREALTPLYKVMSYMVASGRLSYYKMDYSVCNEIGAINNERISNNFFNDAPKCQVSSKLSAY